jgi:uncharacterized protein YndB with AHSA1/START domain
MDSFVADVIFIDAPPARVFDALLEPEDILIWMDAESAVVDAREGGEFQVELGEGAKVAGKISICEAPERLEIAEYRHESPDGSRGPMSLRFLVQPSGEGAWITVRQDGLDSQPHWEGFAQATRRQWVRATVALKRHIEQI